MPTRNGKIARLPREIRDELNRRLDDGELGTSLVAWLNSLPEAQSVLSAHFSGHPVNEQNLSDWKYGGFQDWLRLEDTRSLVRSFAEESSSLSTDSGVDSVSSLLSTPLAAALAHCLRRLADAPPDDPASQRALLAVARELSWLRRVDQGEQFLRLKRERWQAEQARAKKEEADAQCLPGLSREMREFFEDNYNILDRSLPNQAQSTPIKPQNS